MKLYISRRIHTKRAAVYDKINTSIHQIVHNVESPTLVGFYNFLNVVVVFCSIAEKYYVVKTIIS